jgi:hypothetical protein
MTNEWKTSDIKIHTDSQQCRTATHRFQGTLIDMDYYPTSADCRRDAVEVLKEMKELAGV